MTEDYSIPRNLTNSLFKDFELPEQSTIHLRNNPRLPENNIHQSKYRQAEDNDDFINLQLGQQSVIHPRKGADTNNSLSTSHSNGEEDNKPRSKMVVGKRARKNAKAKKLNTQETKQINIDEVVGQIGEWGQKAAKNNSDEDDFDVHQTVGQTNEQKQIQKRINDKLKNGFQSKPGGGGLAAKAEQIKRERQKAQLGSSSKLQETTRAQDSLPPKSKNQTHETSAGLMSEKEKEKQRVIQQSSQEDPWDKVNQKTIQHYQHRKQKQKSMTIDLVLKFYKEEFEFDEADIEIEEVQQNASRENKDAGCLEMLFSCFKAEEKKKPTTKNNNVAIAKRLAAIAKKQLSNTEEEFFMLEQIWTKLTSQPFARYGGHWNQLGFQGRDPATDLRSTGVLSLLQWVLFINDHEKQAGKYAVWSIENQYPLALTHIKITGVFLDLLLRGILQGQKWEDFQSAYNALLIGMLKRMKNQFKGGDNIGTLVEEQARNIKQAFSKELANYQTQYRK